MLKYFLYFLYKIIGVIYNLKIICVQYINDNVNNE